MLELYENIRKYRKELGMSQAELAKRTGYTDRSSIAKIEKGDVDLPQSKIMVFAKALGVAPGELMGDVDPDVKVQTSGHPEWYDYPKTTKYMEAILDKPGLGVLLEGAMELSDENVDLLLNMIEVMKGTNPDG